MSTTLNPLNNNTSTNSSQKIAKKLSKSKQFDYTFKIVMIGDSGVGKSCILLRFADDKFNENFYATIGVDFRFKNIIVDDKSVKLQIWDTAGQERFKTITSAYYRGADGIIIVYDITDRNSFAHIKDWLDDVNKYTDDNPLKIIVGNKIDLIKDKQINENDMKTMTAQTGIEILECSAKDSIKINDLMEIMTKKLIEKKKNEGNKNNTKGMDLNDFNKKNVQNNNNFCC
jgi:Ras-related protein Rab-1A